MYKLNRYGVYLLLSFMLVACGTSKPARFYVMNAVPVSSVNQVPNLSDLTLIVFPVALPDYLDKPQIAIRENSYQIRYNDQHRWAEPMQETVTRVLAENLALRVSPGQVIIADGFVADNADYQLLIAVKRFDKEKAKDVYLQVNWQLLSGDGKDVLHNGIDTIIVKPENNKYLSAVAAHSEALADFSDTIVKIIDLKRKEAQ